MLYTSLQILKTFDHYCEYVKTPSGIILRPSIPGRWLIVFADEVNLPLPDKYNTQHVIMFMRQLCEAEGFWKYQEQTGQWSWITVERIQFAGACNPPTDAGRHPMSDRFLRHAPILFVDFPGRDSLKQIYSTFNRAILRPFPVLRGQAEALTNAMVDFYEQFSEKFTVDMQPHYIYSPRELTRWKVALFEALHEIRGETAADWAGSEGQPTTLSTHLEGFVRLFIHEGLRIFQDRLVEEEERHFTDRMMDEIAVKHFPAISASTLQRPILFTFYLTKNYRESDREELRLLMQGKLRVFNEEELNVKLVLFDQVLDHIVRIDRVLRQPLGHLLLVGASGAGKTVLSKFVSWLNGLSVFQIKAGRKYNTQSFEMDLRTVMKRSGIREERISFIFDESNVLGPAFLERMNALLASGEVPGLFEGDDYTTLMNECKVAFGSDSVGLDEADLFARFTKQVQKNLHIIFTMNPANPDFSNRQATSPALFNRCVVDWFGDWPDEALLQVAYELTETLKISKETFQEECLELPSKKLTGGSLSLSEEEATQRAALANAKVLVHSSLSLVNTKLMKNGKKYNTSSPRDYIDFIRHFMRLVEEKKEEVIEQQRHLNSGLLKLKETEQQVEELQISLSEKEKILAEKNSLAEDKMQLMVTQQSEAEQKKKSAEILAQTLAKKAKVIEERNIEVNNDLSKVEPLLLEAQEAVTNIPKKHLDELRFLSNPPAFVKTAVEATVILLTNAEDKVISWEDARKVLKSHDFINRVRLRCGDVSLFF